jgi:hypothetical protein
MKVGSYVKTSRGNVGVVEIEQHYEIGYYDDIWVCLEKSFVLPNEEEYFKIYGNVQIKKVPNKILLGNKSFPIWDDKLTFLSKVRLTFKKKEMEISLLLNAEETSIISKILDKNKIWYKLS